MEVVPRPARSSRDLERLAADGTPLLGTITRVVDWGAEVSLPDGWLGLLHITDMSWGRVRNPSDIVNPGDEVPLAILKLGVGHRNNRRASLGMKQLTPDPWDVHSVDMWGGITKTGSVSNITDYAIWIQVDGGLEVFVHSCYLHWVDTTLQPSDMFQLGQMVSAKVIEVDRPYRRITGSVRDLQPNPWMEFGLRWAVGEKVDGIITKFNQAGTTILLPHGVHGILRRPNYRPEFRPVRGATVTTVITMIDIDRGRIELCLE